MSKGRLIRYICGILFIVTGVTNLFTQFFSALLAILIGVLLLPIIYDYTLFGYLKKTDIARYAIGAFFIIVGLSGIKDDLNVALVSLVIGISLLPVLYTKTKLSLIRHSSIVVPIVSTVLIFLLAAVFSFMLTISIR